MIRHRLAEWIVKARFFLLALFLACTVFSAFSVGRTRINYDLTRYLAEDTMTRQALTVMQEEFGAAEQLRVMFTDLDEETVRACADRIGEMPEVLAASFSPETDVREEEGHTWSLVTVSLNKADSTETVTALRAMFPEAGRYYVGGSAADQLDIQRSVGEEIPGVMAIAVAVVLVMLLLTSHAWLEPLILLIVLAVSIVINMGTNFIFPDVSFITFAVCAILQLALSIDYAIMLLHTFNGYRDSGLGAKEAMTEAIAECMMRISSSALTTVAGLLSLLFMSYTIGFDIGLVLSKGILISLLGVLLLMPAVTLLMETPLRKTRHRPLALGGEHLAGWIIRFRTPLAVVLILLVLGGLVLNTQTAYSFSGPASGRESESSAVSRRFGSSDLLAILVPGGEEDEDYARQRLLVEKLLAVRKADGEPAVSSVASMVTTGEMALREYTPEDVAGMTGLNAAVVRLYFRSQGFGGSVRGDRLLAAVSGLAEGSGQIAELQQLLAAARKAFIGPTKARLLAEANFTGTDPDLDRYIDEIRAALSDVYGDGCYMTGMPMSHYDISHAFRGDLIRVNLLTLLAILLIVTVSFRSFGLPALIVFVIEGAIWITMGFSCLIGEPVFFISYLICLSIQMGATIDYGILVSDHYRSVRRKGLSPADALKAAMKKALPTVLTSGVILTVAGFIIGKQCSIYYISSIGLLVSRGAFVSVLLVLTLLPALLLSLDRFIIKAPPENPS
ncbi:MAG: MMPL family transporter [Clostridia bacterium]|nr:MMPL family transporter [Clostridia bacterium]